MMRWVATYLLAVGLGLMCQCLASAELLVQPSHVSLDRPEASQQLLVTVLDPANRHSDLTRAAKYEILNRHVATINAHGMIEPRGEGSTILVVQTRYGAARVPLEVKGLLHPPPISFEHEIIPLLTHAGCNSGGCHGKAEGQNGFKLSVFGSSPETDYDTIAKEGRQRRLFAPSPESSLIVRKATARTPHGGGKKIEFDSLPYRRLTRWIAEGAAYVGSQTSLVSMTVEPEQRILFAGETQQIQVTVVDADGRSRDVTAEAEFASNAETIAHVDRDGLVHAAGIPGEAAILIRYMGQSAVCRITIPRPNVTFERPDEASFVDGLVWDKLQRLGIPPSELASDAEFLRRVFIDTIGTLPTPDEARAFLADSRPEKRHELIDRLLNRDEYADYWSMQWSDILRVDRDKLTPAGAVAMNRWLRQQFAANRPYDEFVRDIVTAQGDTFAVGPAAFYRVLDKPEEIARSVSQLLLGIRIECAQCHHHPAEKWGQDDYIGFAGFFTGITRKSLPNGNQAIISRGGSDLQNPRSTQVVTARALGAKPASFEGIADRRQILADWMTSSDNPYLAKSIVNRLWARYFGRGLVEPIDDLRGTNPATNEPLLDALANHLREVKYDLKAFTSILLNSHVYQLSSRATHANADDRQNYSHAGFKTLPAEVLLDAISQSTGVPEKFVGWPLGYRAIQIWDNRMPSYFFTVFGRPVRATVCECERSSEPSIAQAMHLMNSEEIQKKIHDDSGRAQKVASSDASPDSIIDELTLSTLSRFPTAKEKALLAEEFQRSDRRKAAEDVMWALLNSKEFLYNH